MIEKRDKMTEYVELYNKNCGLHLSRKPIKVISEQ